jgi:hypothetical protein
MLVVGTFSVVSWSMECSWIAPCITPAVMVIRGLIFHPLFCIVFISGSYLVCLCVRACFGNLSWQYVNSINWIVCVGDGSIGVCIWLGAPIMHIMSGLNLALHWHFLCGHVQIENEVLNIICPTTTTNNCRALSLQEVEFYG